MQDAISRAVSGISWSRLICKCCSEIQPSPEVWLTLVLDLVVNHALCNSPCVAMQTALTCLLALRIRLVALLVHPDKLF